MALAAAETVGLALNLSRAAYGDTDAAGRCVVIRPDWLAEGQPSIARVHEFRTYGSYIEDLRRGADVIVNDAKTSALSHHLIARSAATSNRTSASPSDCASQ